MTTISKKPTKINQIVMLLLGFGVAFGLHVPFLRAQGMANMDMMNMKTMLRLNSLVYGKYHLHGEEEHHSEEEESNGHGHGASIENGWGLQEVEFGVMSDVDSFLRAVVSASFHGGEWGFEDFYLQSLGMFGNTTLKFGQFYPVIGRWNHIHTHKQPFVERNLNHKELLGDEGLLEFGFEVAQKFFLWVPIEWRGAWLQGKSETLFQFEDGRSDFVGAGAFATHLKGVYDIPNTVSFELGVAYLVGENNFSTSENISLTQLMVVDFTFKWLDRNNKGKNILLLNTEIAPFRHISDGRYEDLAKTLAGGHSLAVIKLMNPLYLQFRHDYVADTFFGRDTTQLRDSVLLAFAPSTFSAFSLQYSLTQDEHDDWSGELVGQINFSVGNHPAHYY